MQIDSFVASHRPTWDRLRELSRRAGRPRRGLQGGEVDEFLQLSERASSHLSHARARYDDAALTAELTHLVATSNSALYRRTSSPAAATRRFFTAAFPGAVWTIRRAVLLAVVATFLPAAMIAAWLANSPEALEVATPEAARAAYVESEFEDYYSSAPAAQFAVQVLINNIQVSFTAFALGVFFSVGSIFILAYNGLNVGVALAVFITAGEQAKFWGLILPHGLLELSAVVIAGAAGMSMGWALVRPGDRTRADAFTTEARRSVTVILGLILIFVIAGLIEGFVTPGLPLVPRLAVGITVFVAFWTYVVTLGSRAAAVGLNEVSDDELEGATARAALSL